LNFYIYDTFVNKKIHTFHIDKVIVMQSLHVMQRLSKIRVLLMAQKSDSFLSRGEIARKSILIVSRSPRGEKRRNICRDGGRGRWRSPRRNKRLLAVRVCIIRARPPTGALAATWRRYWQLILRFKEVPVKIGRTRRGLNWSRDSRNRIAPAAATSANGYL